MREIKRFVKRQRCMHIHIARSMCRSGVNISSRRTTMTTTTLPRISFSQSRQLLLLSIKAKIKRYDWEKSIIKYPKSLYTSHPCAISMGKCTENGSTYGLNLRLIQSIFTLPRYGGLIRPCHLNFVSLLIGASVRRSNTRWTNLCTHSFTMAKLLLVPVNRISFP